MDKNTLMSLYVKCLVLFVPFVGVRSKRIHSVSQMLIHILQIVFIGEIQEAFSTLSKTNGRWTVMYGVMGRDSKAQ